MAASGTYKIASDGGGSSQSFEDSLLNPLTFSQQELSNYYNSGVSSIPGYQWVPGVEGQSSGYFVAPDSSGGLFGKLATGVGTGLSNVLTTAGDVAQQALDDPIGTIASFGTNLQLQYAKDHPDEAAAIALLIATAGASGVGAGAATGGATAAELEAAAAADLAGGMGAAGYGADAAAAYEAAMAGSAAGLAELGATTAAADTAATTGATTAATTGADTAAVTGATTGLLTGANTGSIIGAGLNTIGGIIAGNTASDAAQTQANAQIEAARIAAEAARFKPVGVTSNFGKSNFTFDDKGNLTSAGYTLAPWLQSQQDQLRDASGGLLSQFTGAKAATAPMGDAANIAMRQGTNVLNAGSDMLTESLQWKPTVEAARAAAAGLGTGAQNAMTLGNQYLLTSPQEQAAKYMADQQALLATSRERDLANLQSKLRAQGRLGLATGGTSTGMMAANPEMEAFFNAQRQQDLGLAAQATQGGMDYAKFGAGMVGTGGTLQQSQYDTQSKAYDPFKTAMNLGMDMSKYGTGMVGTGGDLLKQMYGTQTAAYQPYATALGGMQTMEGLGQNALTLGMDMGKTATAASANAGLLTSQGMINAANTMAGANAYSPWAALLSGAGNAIAGMTNSNTQQPMFNPYTGARL